MVTKNLYASLFQTLLISLLVCLLFLFFFQEIRMANEPDKKVSLRKLTTYRGFKSEFKATTSSFVSVYQPSTAVFSDGSFVVTWFGYLTSSDNFIYAQLFSKDTSKIGPEFIVNTDTQDDKEDPTVVVLDNDDFIIVWKSKNSGSYFNLYAKKFDKNGTVLIDETLISYSPNYRYYYPSIIKLNSGKLIVIFSIASSSTDSSYGIFVNEINTQLSILNIDVLVNTYTNSFQLYPVGSGLKEGGFVISWSSYGQVDSSSYEVYAQLFDDSLNKIGNEFLVNTFTSEHQYYSGVAALQDGGFIITWMDHYQNDLYHNISGQKFDSSGNKIGSQFKVNDEFDSRNMNPVPIGFSDGNFMIVWSSFIVNNYVVYVKIYDKDLNTVVSQLEVNSDDGSRNEMNSSGALLENDDYILCYTEEITNEIRCRLTEPCLDSFCLDCTSDSNFCDSCLDSYSIVSGNCIECDSSCSSCYGSLENECISCRSGNTPYQGYCECVFPSVSLWDNPLFCGICSVPNCFECVCGDCDTSPVDGNNSIVCETCNNGYFLNNGECSQCGNNCSVCRSFEECTVCSGHFEAVDGVCYCLDGYYLKEEECLECDELCKECNEKECLECKESLVLENGSCICPPNHTLTEEYCVFSPLTYSISLESYYILIQFSENLKDLLSLKNIEKSCFLPEEKEFKLEIESISLSSYVLRIQETSIPSQTTAIQINFSNIYGSSGNTLEEIDKTEAIQMGSNQILSLTKEEDSSDLEGISGENIAQGSSISSAASAIGVSLISGNPSSLWAFLNIMVLIYYIPLQNVGMPLKTKKYFASFSFDLVDIIPSSDSISNSTSSSSPPEMWVEYGITTTDFVHNNRTFLFLLGLGVGLFVLLGLVLAIWKKGKYREKLYSLFKKLKWNYFLRIYVQYYIKIVLSCLLILGTISDEHYNIVQFLSIILYVFCALSIAFVVIGTYRQREEIEEGELEKYESFYEEFKCDKGWLSMLFYPIFFVRRFVYVSGICFLGSAPLFQVCINSFFSFFLVFYLLYFRPFKETSLNVLNICLETIVGAMFVFSGLFLLDADEKEEEKIEKGLFVLSILAMLMFVFLMLFKVLLALKEFKDSKEKERYEKREEEDGEEKERDLAINTMLPISNREAATRKESNEFEEYHNRSTSSFN